MKNVMKVAVVSLLIFILKFASVQAEPNKTVLGLLNEPVSLFDNGMRRLNDTVQVFQDMTKYLPNGPSPFFFSEAHYNFELNQILIVGTARPHSSDEFEWKEECDKWAKFVREMGGFERDGKLHANFVNGSSYAQKFSHEWISNKRVSEFIKGIDELIFLSCEVFYVEGYEKGKRSSVKVLSDFLGEFSPKTVRKEF